MNLEDLFSSQVTWLVNYELIFNRHRASAVSVKIVLYSVA